MVTENRHDPDLLLVPGMLHSLKQCEGLLSVLVGRIEDLTERLNSLEERLTEHQSPSPSAFTHDPMTMGELVVDHDARRVTIDDREVQLSPMMYSLLHALAVNGNRVVTYDELLRRTPLGRSCDRNNLKVYIGRLRGRLARASAGADNLIQSVRGVGYRLVV